MKDETPKKLLTIRQAAEMTGLSPKTIQNMVYDEKLKRYGTRGKITLDLEEVKAKLIHGYKQTDETAHDESA